MEDTAQRESDLQKKVGESLGVSPEKLKPEDQSPLERIEEEVKQKFKDTGYALGTKISETLGSEVDLSRVDTGKPWWRKTIERARQKLIPFKNLRKAA